MRKYLVLFLTVLLLVGVTAEVGAEEYFSGEWIVTVEEDPLTDEFNLRMTNGYGNSTDALGIRYMNDRLDVLLLTEYLGSGDALLVEVLYRFDEEELVEDFWSPSSSDNALFFFEVESDTKQDFIEKLMIHDKLAVGYWPYNKNRKTIVYDLTGFTAGITPYLDQIGLSELK